MSTLHCTWRVFKSAGPWDPLLPSRACGEPVSGYCTLNGNPTRLCGEHAAMHSGWGHPVLDVVHGENGEEDEAIGSTLASVTATNAIRRQAP